MLPLIQQLLPILITLTTGASVLFHDTQLDRASALAVPVPFSTEDVSDLALTLREAHTHSERVSSGAYQGLTLNDPSIGPRLGDDKKYIASKRLAVDSSGSEYTWPSV